MIRAYTLVLALCVSALALPAWAAEAPDPENATLEKVVPLLQQHRGKDALALLAPLVEANERKIEEAQAKGLVYCATDMSETLLYALLGAEAKKSAIVLNPPVCHGLYFKAFALIDLGRRAEGIAVLERLTSLAPMHSQYISELAFAYNADHRPDLAEKTYRKALENAELAPDVATKRRLRGVALRGIGYSLVEKRDLEGAEKAYRDSLKEEPDSEVAKRELDFIAAHKKSGS